YYAYWIGIAKELGGGTSAARRLRELTLHAEPTEERGLGRAIEIDLTPAAPSPVVPTGLTRPRISIIIAAYHAADTIGATLASIVAETDPRWEAIVVDDGSTDETAAIAATWANGDPRIRIVRRANGGPSLARNTGLHWSRAEWVLFVDADDWLGPTWIA